MTKNHIKSWAVLAAVAVGMVAACSDSKKDEPSTNISFGGSVATAGKASTTGGTPAATGGNLPTETGGVPGAAGSTNVPGAAGSTAVVGGAGQPNVAGSVGTSGGAPSVAGGANLAGAAGQGDCQDAAKNCYRCPATNDAQLLNHCTDYKCIPFDNKTLKKLLADGKVPPLP